jgi:hypothetical protein
MSPFRIPRARIAEGLVVLFIGLTVSNLLVTTGIPRRVLVFVGLVLLVWEALGFADMKREEHFLYLVGAWIALGLFLNGAIYGEAPQEIVYLPGNLAVALALCRHHVRARTAGLLFSAVAGYFIYRLATVFGPDDIQVILATGSANGISEVVLALCGVYYVCVHAEGGRISLLPAALALAVNSLALGRAGIVAAVLLLGGLAVRDVLRAQRLRRRVIRLMLYASCAMLAAVIVWPRLQLVLFVLERFQAYGLESEGRAVIWQAYLDRVNGPELLVGFSRSALFASVSNVHNSFLLWHKTLGALALPLYVLTVLALVLAARRDWLLFLVLAVLLLRSFFDETTLPYRLYDFLFYYLVTTVLVTMRSAATPRDVVGPEPSVG